MKSLKSSALLSHLTCMTPHQRKGKENVTMTCVTNRIANQEMEGGYYKKEQKENLKLCPLFTQNNVRLSSAVTPSLWLTATKGSGEEFSAPQGF